MMLFQSRFNGLHQEQTMLVGVHSLQILIRDFGEVGRRLALKFVLSVLPISLDEVLAKLLSLVFYVALMLDHSINKSIVIIVVKALRIDSLGLFKLF